MTTNKLTWAVFIFVLYITLTLSLDCPRNCELCSNVSTCTKCMPGNYLDTDSTCKPCFYGCQQCTAPNINSSGPICSLCVAPFNLNNNGLCFACDLSCLQCFGNGANCTSCEEGKKLIVTSGIGSCLRDLNCKNELCKECKVGSQVLCQTCRLGFYLTQNQSCNKCQYPCQNCVFDINSTKIIMDLQNGITQIKRIVGIYDTYMFQLSDFKAKYTNWTILKMANPNITFQQYLLASNTTYTLLGPSSNYQSFNLSSPDFGSMIIGLKPYFSFFIDETLEHNIENMINMGSFSSIFNNLNNSSNPLNSFGNLTDLFGNIFGNFANITDLFSNFSSNFSLNSNFSSFFNLSNITTNMTIPPNFNNMSAPAFPPIQLTSQMVLIFLFNQPSFKRYYTGSLQQFLSNNSLMYFNFDNAPPSCIACLQGFFFDSVNKRCATCSPNCKLCNTTGICNECVSGYSISLGQCVKCEYPCSQCSDLPTKCTECFAPFKLTGSNACVLCQSPCLTCDSSNSTKCLKCIRPFSEIANVDGICFPCEQGICKVCQPSNVSYCIQCSIGSTLNNGRCQMCQQNCLQCLNSLNPSSSQCYKCKQRFVVDLNTKKCVPCSPNCITCKQENPLVCITCQKGTYRNQLGICKICNEACIQCKDSNLCTVYKQGKKIINGQMLQCRQGCKKCSSQNLQICYECDSKFFFNKNTCLRCHQGCLTCETNNITKCTSCPPNKFLSVDRCVQCSENCVACTSQRNCLTCKRGFILNSSSCIDSKTICNNGCLRCSGSICKECDFGFSLSETGKCVKCPSKCGGSCDQSNPQLCTSCKIGFQLIQGNCIRCPKNCQVCYNSQCSICQEGYHLFQDQMNIICKKSCLYPCKKCSQNTCLECATNFTMINGKCQPDLLCGNRGCDSCMSGSFKKFDGQCQKCKNNCASCTNQTFCLGCENGFYANRQGQCLSCSEGSVKCLDAQISTLCKIGYIKQALMMNTQSTDLSSVMFSNKCVPCQSPCKQCMVMRNLCTSCISEQYRLNGTSCIKRLVVGIQIKFDVNYENFLKSGSLYDIIKILQQKITATIVISYIFKGSLIAGFAASPSDNSNANAVGNQANSLINSNNLGYPIVGSSVGLFLDDSPYSSGQESKNTGLIVGIIVGVSGLLISAGIIIYKVKKAKQLQQIRVVDGKQIQVTEMNIECNNNKVENVMTTSDKFEQN